MQARVVRHHALTVARDEPGGRVAAVFPGPGGPDRCPHDLRRFRIRVAPTLVGSGPVPTTCVGSGPARGTARVGVGRVRGRPVRAAAGGSAGLGGGAGPSATGFGVAYVLSRVPSQYTHRSCSASYSHTASPSTTTPTRMPLRTAAERLAVEAPGRQFLDGCR